MKTTGKVVGIDFKEGTKQDGTKWTKYSYGIDIPGTGKRFFSAWQKYDVQMGQDVAIEYEETLNQKNPQFPFKNIKSMAVVAQGVQQAFPGVNMPKPQDSGITQEFVQAIKPAYKSKVPAEQQNENHFVGTILRTYAKTHSETLAKKLDMIVQVYNN